MHQRWNWGATPPCKKPILDHRCSVLVISSSQRLLRLLLLLLLLHLLPLLLLLLLPLLLRGQIDFHRPHPW